MFSLKIFKPCDYSKVSSIVKSDNPDFLKSVSIVIDQYDSKEFNLNDAGWPRNDISQLARAQSKSEYDSIMARLAVRDSGKSNIVAGMTDEQIYDSVRPRYAQSPLELAMFAEYSNGSVSDYLISQYGKKVSTDDVKAQEEVVAAKIE